MFEHTSNSLLFMGAAFVAILFWLDSRTGKPPHAYAGNAAPHRAPEQAPSAPAPYQAASQPRPAQAPTAPAMSQTEPAPGAPTP
jgi:predicted component of type VI protein secretion system